jgi:hypothetical protein
MADQKLIGSLSVINFGAPAGLLSNLEYARVDTAGAFFHFLKLSATPFKHSDINIEI